MHDPTFYVPQSWAGGCDSIQAPGLPDDEFGEVLDDTNDDSGDEDILDNHELVSNTDVMTENQLVFARTSGIANTIQEFYSAMLKVELMLRHQGISCQLAQSVLSSSQPPREGNNPRSLSIP